MKFKNRKLSEEIEIGRIDHKAVLGREGPNPDENGNLGDVYSER